MAYTTYLSADGATMDVDIVGGEVVAVRLTNPTPYVAVAKLISPSRVLRVERLASGGEVTQNIPRNQRGDITVTADGLELPAGWDVELYLCQSGKDAGSVA